MNIYILNFLPSGIECHVVRWGQSTFRRNMSPLSSGSKQSFVCYLFHPSFLVGLFFDPENRGNILIRKVGWLSTDSRRYIPETELSIPTSGKTSNPASKYLLKEWIILFFFEWLSQVKTKPNELWELPAKANIKQTSMFKSFKENFDSTARWHQPYYKVQPEYFSFLTSPVTKREEFS
jgi:hypothetical protein